MKAKRQRDKVLLRVGKGALIPHDGVSAMQLRAKGFKLGDVLAADLSKPRNPAFHRLAHQVGALLAENLEAFEDLDSHGVLKRLQIEGDIACDSIPLNMPGIGPVEYRVPRSLSFASMDEAEFRQTIAAMCRYVSKRYWPSCTPEQIEAMASAWVEAT